MRTSTFSVGRVVGVVAACGAVSSVALGAEPPPGTMIKSKWHLRLGVADQWHYRSFDGNGWGNFRSPIFDDDYHWHPTTGGSAANIATITNSTAFATITVQDGMSPIVTLNPGESVMHDVTSLTFSVFQGEPASEGDVITIAPMAFDGSNALFELERYTFDLFTNNLIVDLFDDEMGPINVNTAFWPQSNFPLGTGGIEGKLIFEVPTPGGAGALALGLGCVGLRRRRR